MAKYTRELLAQAATNSTSIAAVLRYLGLRQAGGTQAHIGRRLKALDIDTTHFTGRAHNRGKPGRRIPPDELFSVRPQGSKRNPGQRLIAAVRLVNRQIECEGCGIGPVWNGMPLTLHVDHKNGDFLDNRLWNLRILCPNCHSQTPTFANRKRVRLESIDVAGVAEWQTRRS